MPRTFEDKPAVRVATPLLIGLAAPSGGGKTFSALRLGSGIQRVVGGELYFIDTEARRALHYADKFKFRHIDFSAPFSPLDYMAAIDHCVEKGAKTIIVDSMTHEHAGSGGVLDQADKFLDKKAGDDQGQRDKYLMLSLKSPKLDRKKLNDRIVQLSNVNFIFCYRAHEKVKPVTGQGVQNLGWMPETTSNLVYEMTCRFLLMPASDGKPDMSPQTRAESMLQKNPEQFKGWFAKDFQLTEDLGEKFARWAQGGVGAPPAGAGTAAGPVPAPSDKVPLTPVDVLLPPGWNEWSNEMRGENRALKGLAAYQLWWENALTGKERVELKAKHAEWKARAAEIQPAQASLL